MRATRAVLPALLLALAPPPADAAEPAEPKPAETPLAVMTGTIRSIDLDAHRVVLEVQGATATLAIDRNSLVYLPGGLATVAALRPGDEVRAGRNGRNVAYWIEVRRRDAGAAGAPAAKPGQGTGTGGAAPPPAETRAATPAPSAHP